jgi:hypothetical protein
LKLDCFVKTRYTHGGQLRQVRRTEIPAQELTLNFLAITSASKDSLIQFLQQNAARKVFVTDENGVQWYGFVTSDKITFTVHGSGSGCRLWDTQLEFEGLIEEDL